ncbi:hypothetical protein GVN16_03905 [Emticicia sp. CRIBPO]|uniref:hypothetical protein n=1 Tax=Emticicia sp. CRIBPO TaxID=2683258 RepID=UPI001411C9EB|nr:hypothetical protein [Emticicia sp. CRIBPO]NBA84886.1 hypothetical protein [Emticicia sp. CRIBPO]
MRKGFAVRRCSATSLQEFDGLLNDRYILNGGQRPRDAFLTSEDVGQPFIEIINRYILLGGQRPQYAFLTSEDVGKQNIFPTTVSKSKPIPLICSPSELIYTYA